MFHLNLKTLINLTVIISFGYSSKCQDFSDKLECPYDITGKTDSGECGTRVTYSNPFAQIDQKELSEVQNNFESDSYFTQGETTVYYKATDIKNNSYFCIFKVKVIDSENPSFVSFPENISIKASAIDGTFVTWEEPISADNCSDVYIISDYESGDYFPIGKTEVTYTATDLNGNFVTKTFSVQVTRDSSLLANSK